MSAIQTPRVFVLTQPATAIARDFVVKTGWRPSMIRAFVGELGSWVKVDKFTTHAGEEVLTQPDGSGSADVDTDNVCTILDDGFRLEASTTWVRVNNITMIILAFPPGVDGPFEVGLGDTDIQAYMSDFGAGTQYDPTPQDENEFYWIQRVDP